MERGGDDDRFAGKVFSGRTSVSCKEYPMTDGRYDGRRGSYDSPRPNYDRYDRSSRDDRGFFDRARDEVSSWFGDDDAEHRRDRDTRQDDSRFGREQSRDRYDRNPRDRDDGMRRPYTGRSTGRSSFGDDFDRPQSGFDRGQGFERGQSFDRGGSQREGASLTAPTLAGGRHDRDYAEWRSRQIDDLDRDYEEFRRENQSRFDSEFSTWRGQRQTKRQLLGQVAEHMEVVGSDEQPVGKVDHIRRDRIILTKSDSPDGRHHSISCAKIDRVENGKVFLDKTAEEAKREFADDLRNRALGERDDQGEDGPHMLNRSFSGTY
jgi:hypothetical protein